MRLFQHFSIAMVTVFMLAFVPTIRADWIDEIVVAQIEVRRVPGLSLAVIRDGKVMMHHHGSTVGGFGSVVRHFPDEKLTLAVMCNLEDGGWCAEYIAKRVANRYISGSFIGGLSAIGDDAGSKIADVHLKLLREVADNQNPEQLASSYAPKISKAFRDQTAKNIDSLKSFVYLGKEPIGLHHFVLDNGWTEARYFKMTTRDRILYYHFRCYQDGKVGLIFSEDE
ncbi:MAG: hypothetical protein ABL921_05015 [Pirellula sp.]